MLQPSNEMHKTGHYGAALLLYAPVGFALSRIDPSLFLPCGLGAVALARLPDYDRNVPFVTHRGPTHTLLFLVIVAVSSSLVGYHVAEHVGTDGLQWTAIGAIASMVAVGSHLLADVLTPAGVPLLWPLTDQRYSLDVVVASDLAANYGLLAAGIVATAAIVVLSG